RAVADVNKCAPVGRRAAGAAFVVKPDAAGRERRHRADRTKIAKPQRVRAVVGKHDRLVEVRALRDQLLDEAVYLSSRGRRVEPDIAAPRLPEAVALRIEPLRCSDNMLREFVAGRVAVDAAHGGPRPLNPFRWSIPFVVSGGAGKHGLYARFGWRNGAGFDLRNNITRTRSRLPGEFRRSGYCNFAALSGSDQFGSPFFPYNGSIL